MPHTDRNGNQLAYVRPDQHSDSHLSLFFLEGLKKQIYFKLLMATFYINGNVV
jgi:hypothetical protein